MGKEPRHIRPANSMYEETDPNAKTRRIDSSTPAAEGETDSSWQNLVGGTGSFRAERGRTTNRTTKNIPAINSQRMSAWLQGGGWKIIAAGAVVLLLMLIFLLVNNNPGAKPQAINPSPSSSSALGNLTKPTAAIEQLDPNAPPTTVAAQNPPAQAQPASNAARFVVTGTGTQGLFLRDNPGGNILKTMPEGTEVEKLNEQNVEGVVWFNVREPGGLSGWSSSAFLVAVP